LQRLLRSDELVQAVGTNKQIRVALNVDQRAGDRVLSVRELSKSYDGKKLWADVALEIKRGERVGIVGPNGSGKTTLLEVLLGRRDADAGSVRWGANLSLGYYDQQLHDFDLENSVADEVRGDRRITDQDLRSILGMMLFRDEQIERPIRQLSGGERARVAIAQLLLDRPNVLLMDEPTNHLDIQSSEAVESALRDFDGTILCVSHDRYFLDRVVSRLLVLQPPVIVQFDGNFTAWSKHAAPKRLAPPPKLQKPQKPQPPAQAKKKSQNAFARPFGRLTLDQLEKQITQTEIALAECQSSFADPAISRAADASRKLNEQYQTLQRKLADLEAEYFARSA
jgi:ATP-binding cassette subfamily F protein 3